MGVLRSAVLAARVRAGRRRAGLRHPGSLLCPLVGCSRPRGSTVDNLFGLAQQLRLSSRIVRLPGQHAFRDPLSCQPRPPPCLFCRYRGEAENGPCAAWRTAGSTLSSPERSPSAIRSPSPRSSSGPLSYNAPRQCHRVMRSMASASNFLSQAFRPQRPVSDVRRDIPVFARSDFVLNGPGVDQGCMGDSLAVESVRLYYCRGKRGASHGQETFSDFRYFVCAGLIKSGYKGRQRVSLHGWRLIMMRRTTRSGRCPENGRCV